MLILTVVQLNKVWFVIGLIAFIMICLQLAVVAAWLISDAVTEVRFNHQKKKEARAASGEGMKHED